VAPMPPLLTSIARWCVALRSPNVFITTLGAREEVTDCGVRRAGQEGWARRGGEEGGGAGRASVERGQDAGLLGQGRGGLRLDACA
jgi:hypothetical protein